MGSKLGQISPAEYWRRQTNDMSFCCLAKTTCNLIQGCFCHLKENTCRLQSCAKRHVIWFGINLSCLRKMTCHFLKFKKWHVVQPVLKLMIWGENDTSFLKDRKQHFSAQTPNDMLFSAETFRSFLENDMSFSGPRKLKKNKNKKWVFLRKFS